jgi:ElaB/YqjD/DUF883 family membrane-anchored ribosome-binding protein
MPNPDSSIEFRTRDPLGVTADDTSAKLAEVRAELAAVVAEFKSVVEARSAQATVVVAEVAEVGLDFTRETIRSHPLPAIAVAAVAGAVIGLALLPVSPSAHPRRRAEWVPDAIQPHLDRKLEAVQRSAESNGSSFLSAFERVVNSVSSIDSKSSLTPTLEKAATWLNSLRGSFGGK